MNYEESYLLEIDYKIAKLFLRYDTRETSWATFLKETGWFTDGNTSRKDDGYFYRIREVDIFRRN